MPDSHPYRRVAAQATEGRPSTVTVGGASFGGGHFGVIAGSPTGAGVEQAVARARELAAAGATMLHDGTSSQTDPYARRVADRLEVAAAMREATGLPVAVGLTDPNELDDVAAGADAIQVAGFHMQNYTLLSELGRIDCPVLLRRGSAALIEELLMAAEYIVHGGNDQVLLCERGVRTFERAYEVIVDFAAIPILKEKTHLPVLVDPSEHRDPRIVYSLALAAAAAGADGVVLEVEEDPGDLVERLQRAAAIL
jgi:3-deoxy-7-phosphoheptulonate synthase